MGFEAEGRRAARMAEAGCKEVWTERQAAGEAAGEAAELEKEKLAAVLEEHAGLVRMVAGRMVRSGSRNMADGDLDDLMQIGYIGLIKAARRFEPERGLQFSTYAVPMIAGEIRSQLRDQGAVKMSRSLKADIALVRRAESDFLKLHGTAPRLSQLAEASGMSTERVQEVMLAADALQNMPDLDGCDAEQNPSLWTDCEEQNVSRMDLKAAISALEPRARKVIVLRYYRDYTQQQVADLLGISQVQVCRIEKRTLQEMAKRCT